jgi:GWxTD domain-containing protein
MLVSNIEESAGRYAITPHLSDNVGNLMEGYFCFFEVYNHLDLHDVNIGIEIKDNAADSVIYNKQVQKHIDTGTAQLYVQIPGDIKYGLKTNTITLYFYKFEAQTTASDTNPQVLAAAQRTVRCESFLYNRIFADVNEAISKLRYVATSSQLSPMKNAKTDGDKLQLVQEFWKKIDPTPNTERNEAMEEYYTRMDYANKTFKAYTDGWLTDKGHCYIVYGQPDNIEKSNQSLADNRTFEQWSYYGTNRTIVFLDVTGFGDFRLYSPKIITDLYEY